ncbi:MAG: tRNA (cytidine(56)-2'-O)-methyltransferase [Ignisphaera sp.]
MSYCTTSPEKLGIDVYVLRLGHRPSRDRRVTTHVALVARAFGARGIYIAEIVDENVRRSIEKVIDRWGGRYFKIEMGINPVNLIDSFRNSGGCIVHLTMYGLPLDSVIDVVRENCSKILVVVGSEKVERIFYELADYNIAVGSQPHSEVSALALFLDRLWKGVELGLCFHDAKYYIIPSTKSKVVKRVE